MIGHTCLFPQTRLVLARRPRRKRQQKGSAQPLNGINLDVDVVHALIDTIADAYLEQPGEAARLGRHTVVSALMQCLQLPNPL